MRDWGNLSVPLKPSPWGPTPQKPSPWGEGGWPSGQTDEGTGFGLRSFSAGGFRRLWAASDFLDAQKVTKEPLGGGSGWALRAHIRRPLEPHYGGRATGRFLNISGAQNLSGLCDSSRATSSSRISYPSLRPAGQSSLTPSLLLSNANPLRWALRWGPPSAAYWGGKFQMVRLCNCA